MMTYKTPPGVRSAPVSPLPVETHPVHLTSFRHLGLFDRWSCTCACGSHGSATTSSWSSTPRKQTSCLRPQCTYRAPGLTWQAGWTSTAASTGKCPALGESALTEQAGGQVWELCFYPTWEIVSFLRLSLRTSRGRVMRSRITPGVLLEGFSVGSALKILHFLEKLHVLLSILAQIHKKQGLPLWLRQ